MNKIIKIVAYALLVLAVVAVIGFIAVFTDGFTSGFKTFYVTYDGEMILSNKNLDFDTDTELKFDVAYTFSTGETSTKDYYVSVKPYVTEDNNFDFAAGGSNVSFSSIADSDVSTSFGLVKEESYFTLNIPKGTTVASVIQSLYDDDVTVSETADIGATAYFAIYVTSYNEESTIVLPFTVNTIEVVENINITYDGSLIF